MPILAIRELTVPDLTWFHGTRAFYKDVALYRHRLPAVTINAHVFERWFPKAAADQKVVYVQVRYLGGVGPTLSDDTVVDVRVPIRRTGLPSWRLTGNPIRGDFYGTIRPGDLMLMSFDEASHTLSWLCIRGGALFPPRTVPAEELATYELMRQRIGEPSTGQGMWLVEDPDTHKRVIDLASDLYPSARQLLEGTSDYRQTVRTLWNLYRSAGFTSNIAVEQIGYLMYLKYVDQRALIDEISSGLMNDDDLGFFDRLGLNELRWSYVRQTWSGDTLQEQILAAFQTLLTNTELNGDPFASVMTSASLSVKNPEFLTEAMGLVDSLPLSDPARAGPVFEELLTYLEAGRSGFYPTPPHLIDTMVQLGASGPFPDLACVKDPVCGTGGFLVAAQKAYGDLTSRQLIGVDADPAAARLAALNLKLHGIIDPHIYIREGAARRGGALTTSVVFANLAWQGRLNRALSDSESRGAPEVVHTSVALDQVRPNGYAILLVPDSLLYGASREHRDLRRTLLEENRVDAVISLPEEALLPHVSSKSSILVVRRGGQTENVWFFDVTGDGYTLTPERLPDPGNNTLRLVVKAFSEATRGEALEWDNEGDWETAVALSWMVGRQAIVSQEYVLAATFHDPRIAGQTESPRQILKRVRSLEQQLLGQLENLGNLLGEDSHE